MKQSSEISYDHTKFLFSFNSVLQVQQAIKEQFIMCVLYMLIVVWSMLEIKKTILRNCFPWLALLIFLSFCLSARFY